MHSPWHIGVLNGGSYGKESACNMGDLGLILGSGRFPWRAEWQSTPVFLPGESHGQKLQSMRLQRVRYDWATNTFSVIATKLIWWPVGKGGRLVSGRMAVQEEGSSRLAIIIAIIKMPPWFVESLPGPASVLGALHLCSGQCPKADVVNLEGPELLPKLFKITQTVTQAGLNTLLTKDMLACLLLLLLFSHYVVFNSLQPHGLQQARLLCPSLSPGVCSNSCPLSRWCHPTISSSISPFSSCSKSFPASGSRNVIDWSASVFTYLINHRPQASVSAKIPWSVKS